MINKVDRFVITIDETEYIFECGNEASLFNVGYQHGLVNKEPISLTRSYKHGYQLGEEKCKRNIK